MAGQLRDPFRVLPDCSVVLSAAGSTEGLRLLGRQREAERRERGMQVDIMLHQISGPEPAAPLRPSIARFLALCVHMHMPDVLAQPTERTHP